MQTPTNQPSRTTGKPDNRTTGKPDNQTTGTSDKPDSRITRPVSPISEKAIEQRLRVEIKARDGLALKFVSPGHMGVSDRIVLMPGGRIWFVETKTPGRKLTALQHLFAKTVTGLDFQHRVIDSYEALTQFLQEVDHAL